MSNQVLPHINTEAVRVYLQQELVGRCRANSSYSLRGFARDLKIDNSVLSKILNGKRRLGSKLACRLISCLEVSPKVMKKFLTNESKNREGYDQLAVDTFAIISDWHHYAILELLRLDHYRSEPGWMAKALGMTTAECRDAVERLIRVGLVERWDDGELTDISGGKSTNISSDMKHGALRKMQKQLLEKSIECIDQVEYEKRNNTSMTMAIDTEKLPEAIEEISKFRRKMGSLLSRGTRRDQVYNLSVALCPLSNIEYKPKENQ